MLEMNEVAARTLARARPRTRVQDTYVFWAATGALTATLAGVLGWFLMRWPPHEDETLALFVGRGSFGDLLHTVIAERGGAPLHFAFGWTVVHLGGGLGALRVVSLLFAVASIPPIALLGARLWDRSTGLVAATFASATWVMLFNGVYGRMYSLFLFTSLLSFLALLNALEQGGRRRFALWGMTLLLVLASHPYAVLVIAAQVLFVALRRRHLRPTLATLAAVAALGAPFWWADIVLRDRFDVGVGGGGNRLGSVGSVLDYLRWTSGDFGAGHDAWGVPLLVVALIGAALVVRRRPEALLLTVCVVAVPALAFTLATLGSSASPESRHLIFALPFFSTLIAVAFVEGARLRAPLTVVLALVAAAALVGGEVRWAHEKTPALFDGDSPTKVAARHAAGVWLAATGRSDDVLLGYEPLFLEAWERDRSFSANAIPRADSVLLASALKDVPEPLGRGVWVLDAADTTNVWQRQTIPFALPEPRAAFEGRRYGPYLVIRSRAPLRTRSRYITISILVMELGRRLRITDADVNLHALRGAASRF